MKFLTLSAFLSMASVTALASSITPIESPHIKCSQDGGAVLVNLAQERLWQADSIEDKEGLELEVESFQRMRCPGCYLVKGSLSVMGQQLPLSYEFGPKDRDYTKLQLSVTGGADEDSFDIAQMDCDAKY